MCVDRKDFIETFFSKVASFEIAPGCLDNQTITKSFSTHHQKPHQLPFQRSITWGWRHRLWDENNVINLRCGKTLKAKCPRRIISATEWDQKRNLMIFALKARRHLTVSIEGEKKRDSLDGNIVCIKSEWKQERGKKNIAVFIRFGKCRLLGPYLLSPLIFPSSSSSSRASYTSLHDLKRYQ